MSLQYSTPSVLLTTMDYADIIIALYNRVYEQQKKKFRVGVEDIRKAIGNMKDAYMPDPSWELKTEMKFTDYNDGAHRCAYLHKHAMIHTNLVCYFLQRAFRNRSINRDINSKRKLNLCSLGGGPGNDVTALLLVLKEIFGFIQCNVSIIDCDSNWEHVFKDILEELRSGRYGSVKEMVDRRYFTYQYLITDLLNPSYYSQWSIHSAITNADFITMIKFVSSAACNKTRRMLKALFQYMKAGAMVMFVDNAAGGFYNMVNQIAIENSMEEIFGPFEHYEYEEERFNKKLYGYTSQYKTKVTVAIWQKVQTSYFNQSAQLQREYVYGRPHRITAESSSVRIAEESDSCCSII